MRVLYIIHYGFAPKDFYWDRIKNRPKRIIGDGGSNIHIHLIQFLIKKGAEITLSTFKNNYQYLAFFKKKRQITFDCFWIPPVLQGRYYPVIDSLYKIFLIPLKIFVNRPDYDALVSVTDFLPDVLYAFLIRARQPRIKWVASFFLAAPKPWARDNPYKTNLKRYLTGIIYWFGQQLSYWLIKWRADFVLVTSEPDVKRFVTKKRQKKKVVVVQGGVDIEEAKQYLKRKKTIPVEKRQYDACFMGRFHYQKGVLELVDIWREVCRVKPQAKLAMIGNGPLESAVAKKIKQYSLEKNIGLLGFKAGESKYQIFKQAKIMVHPATYDSGGMSAAEGMAWGLPSVSFDLEALRTYYPKGMIKTPRGDLKKFAANILELLENKRLYQRTAKKAINLTQEVWDWKVRANKIYQQLFS